MSVVAVTYLIVEPLSAAVGFQNNEAWLSALQGFALFTFGLIPVAIGFAVLRYRLYEIDVVINQTVVFGVAGGVHHGRLRRDRRRGSARSPAAAASPCVSARRRRDRRDRVPARPDAGRSGSRTGWSTGSARRPTRCLSAFSERLAGRLRRRGPAAPDGPDPRRRDRRRARGRVAEGGRPAPAGRRLAGRRAGPRCRRCPRRRGRPRVRCATRASCSARCRSTKRPGEQISATEERLIADLASQAGLVLRNVGADRGARGARASGCVGGPGRGAAQDRAQPARRRAAAAGRPGRAAQARTHARRPGPGARRGRCWTGCRDGDERARGPARPRARDLPAAARRQGPRRRAGRPGAQGRGAGHGGLRRRSAGIPARSRPRCTSAPWRR